MPACRWSSEAHHLHLWPLVLLVAQFQVLASSWSSKSEGGRAGGLSALSAFFEATLEKEDVNVGEMQSVSAKLLDVSMTIDF